MVSASDGDGIYSFVGNDFGTLVPNAGNADVLPGTPGQVAIYNMTGTQVQGYDTLPASVQLTVDNYDSGTNASSSTFLRGDGTWQTAGGGGDDAFASSLALIDAATTTNYVVSNPPETTIDFSMLLVVNGTITATYSNATTVNLSNLQSVGIDFMLNFPVATGLAMDSLTNVIGQFGLQLNIGTSFSAANLANVGGFFPYFGGLTSLSLPALATSTANLGGIFPSLTTLSLPALVSITGNFGGNYPSLTSISLPAITTITTDISPTISTSLTSFSLNAGLLLVGGDVILSGSGLDQASVDGVLVSLAALNGAGGTTSYDGHTVDLSGGTAATPSATGLAAKATLVGRGNTVITN